MKTTNSLRYIPIILFFIACTGLSSIQKSGKHYQKHQDYSSLQKVVDRISLYSDTSLVKEILGEPIDMGFDYRYLLDSTNESGCVVGAVFHINDDGKIDQKWIGPICE